MELKKGPPEYPYLDPAAGLAGSSFAGTTSGLEREAQFCPLSFRYQFFCSTSNAFWGRHEIGREIPEEFAQVPLEVKKVSFSLGTSELFEKSMRFSKDVQQKFSGPLGGEKK